MYWCYSLPSVTSNAWILSSAAILISWCGDKIPFNVSYKASLRLLFTSGLLAIELLLVKGEMDAIAFIYTGYTIKLPKWTYSFLTPQSNGNIQLISSLLHVRNVNPSSIMSQNTKNTQKVTAFTTTDNQVCHW